MKLIRGISGIRGIVGDTLTEPIISKYVQAFSMIQGKGEILIARDSRIHGSSLINASCHALKKCGRQVLNYKIIPTPTAQFIVEKNNLAGGIVITASHNPSEWNGLKFIDSDGCFLRNEKNQNLFDTADDLLLNEKKSGNIIDIDSGYLSHIEHTRNLSVIDPESIEKQNYKVVVDAVNGAASHALPAMLEALGCKVYKLYCKADGKFPRGAEPLSHNLTELGKTVVEKQASIGFATDPDGDRLAIVNEKGQPIGEEYTLVICLDGFLKSTKSTIPIVTNLSTTMAIDRIAEKYGTSVIRTAVGEINVVNKMKKINAQFGGEGNGGVILAESHYGRDSLVGSALFLNRMAQETKTVSEIFKCMPPYFMIKNKIELGSINPNSAINRIKSIFLDANKDTTDGLKLVWDNSWIHIRASNTEPIFRIFAEAPTEQDAKKLINKVKSSL